MVGHIPSDHPLAFHQTSITKEINPCRPREMKGTLHYLASGEVQGLRGLCSCRLMRIAIIYMILLGPVTQGEVLLQAIYVG